MYGNEAIARYSQELKNKPQNIWMNELWLAHHFIANLYIPFSLLITLITNEVNVKRERMRE